MKPKRIQLRRSRGWRLPPETVNVARPTKWGNPWRVGDVLGCDMDESEDYRGSAAVITAELACALYRAALLSPPTSYVCHPDGRRTVITGLASGVTAVDVVRELRGRHLACWCPAERPCHADVLLEVANR